MLLHVLFYMFSMLLHMCICARVRLLILILFLVLLHTAMSYKSYDMHARYDTRCYFNVSSKADMSRLNLPHGDDN